MKHRGSFPHRMDAPDRHNGKETNERTDGRTDGRRRLFVRLSIIIIIIILFTKYSNKQKYVTYREISNMA